MPAAGPSPILITSSEPEGSPPIMVIDDDEPVAFAVQMDAEDHFRRFPSFSRSSNYAAMVRDLTQHVHTGMSPMSDHPPVPR